MKFGKRRKDEEPVAEPTGVSAPPSAEPVPVKWSVADTPPAAAEPDPEPDTVVDAEAFELPADDAVAEAPAPAPAGPEPPARAPAAPGSEWVPTPAAAAYLPPQAAPMAFPVADQPVSVAGDGRGATPLSETGAAYASGHAPGTSPSWPEPVMQLANERPEVVVGAAFAGGLLFAAILRRLGN
ncbi:MAG TPA: hypothetical protein VMY78_16465 [Solirubrobacteraceae bacterium]|nr:hypothetical protein [Solirubrobacteraceae bacterium]